ncbi:MAG: pilus assembly protein [Methylibium sp.]|nr:pilus assembly protein [Methylibium sp.]MBA3623172.1 pilus assembly protein [Methylibium sp.]
MTHKSARKTARRRMLGVAVVELGLTMAPVLILTFGVTEYGRAIYTYNTIDKAARDAARYMTAPPPGSADPEAEARNLVVYGNVAGSGAPLAPGLTTGKVEICRACDAAHIAVPTGSGVVNLVTVRITGYVYTSIVTYVAPATLNFSDISVTMRTNL